MTFSTYLNNYLLKCQLKDLSLRFERSLTWNSNTTTQSFQNSDFLFPKKLCLNNLSFCQFLHLVRHEDLRILWNGESQSWMDTDIPFYYFLHVNFAVGRKETCGVVIAPPCYIMPNIIIGGTPIIMTSYRQPTVLDWKDNPSRVIKILAKLSLII